jgi:hypothetical protein
MQIVIQKILTLPVSPCKLSISKEHLLSKKMSQNYNKAIKTIYHSSFTNVLGNMRHTTKQTTWTKEQRKICITQIIITIIRSSGTNRDESAVVDCWYYTQRQKEMKILGN